MGGTGSGPGLSAVECGRMVLGKNAVIAMRPGERRRGRWFGMRRALVSSRSPPIALRRRRARIVVKDIAPWHQPPPPPETFRRKERPKPKLRSCTTVPQPRMHSLRSNKPTHKASRQRRIPLKTGRHADNPVPIALPASRRSPETARTPAVADTSNSDH